MGPVMSGPFMVSAHPGGGGRGRAEQKGGGGVARRKKTLKCVCGKEGNLAYCTTRRMRRKEGWVG